MLLLDSRSVPRQDRVDLITTVLTDASGATATLEPHPEVYARMDLWQLGQVALFRNASSGIAMACNPRQARNGSPLVALAVQERSAAVHEQFGHRQQVRPGELMLVDLTAPFAFRWRAAGASRAIQIPLTELGLSMEIVRSAGPLLARSPLARTVTNLVIDLFRDAEQISADPFASSAGTTTLDLVRALIASAAARGPEARTVHHETLLAQIREYMRQHLRDPDLTPASIARAHNISLRHLYSLTAEASFSPQQWIMTRRLDGARTDLALPGTRTRAIATVARRWGFRDPAHFTRRFRSAYGMTPTEWQRAAQKTRTP